MSRAFNFLSGTPLWRESHNVGGLLFRRHHHHRERAAILLGRRDGHRDGLCQHGRLPELHVVRVVPPGLAHGDFSEIWIGNPFIQHKRSRVTKEVILLGT